MRWAIKARPYPARAAFECSIQLEGLGKKREKLWGSSIITAFPVSHAKNNKVAELWESSRLGCRGSFGEQPKNLMKVRKFCPERR